MTVGSTAIRTLETLDKMLAAGGTIDLGNSENWQERLITELRALNLPFPLTISNPSREQWYGEPTTDNPEFVRQVNWELNHLQRADIVMMRLLAGSHSPVSLLELGLNAFESTLIVYCDRGFWRAGNVDIVCDRLSIPTVNSDRELLDAVVNKAREVVDGSRRGE